MSMYGYVGLCWGMKGYVWLCTAMSGYVTARKIGFTPNLLRANLVQKKAN